MGYDLISKSKDVGFQPTGMLFTWPQILNETGAGYLFGYGINTVGPGSYIYNGLRGPGSPVSNDGFDVTDYEAKVMARLFGGYVFVKRAIREHWDALSEMERRAILDINSNRCPPSTEFINKVESLIDFCENSGGFTIE
ncbi:hypothetical protein FACS1894177_06450 [Bacteroidia bacterium]|nr:hypothetical protein FACS1894177_06450 [Bacteroidia bacterium]